jgi:prepilin-type N-terminal cleavage/methylation domain-containing protein
MSWRKAAGSDNQRGFTLIELLLAVVIVGLIMVPLANTLIIYLKTSDATMTRLTQSHDQQIPAAYLAQDVQSVGMRDYSTNPPSLLAVKSVWNSAFPACGSGNAQKLVLGWDDFSNATPSSFSATTTKPQHVYASYVIEADGQLHRITCVGDGASSGVDIVLTHQLAVSPAPTALCDGGSCGTAFPNNVTLAIYIQGFAQPLTLIGQRRQGS